MHRRIVLTVLLAGGLLVTLASGPSEAGSGPTCRGNLATVDLAQGQQPTPDRDVIVGTPGPDHISGLGGKDVICGGGGPDRIAGDGGADSIYGGRGDDWLHGGPRNDRISDGPGDDTMIGGAGDADQCYAGNGIERISPTCEIVAIP